MIWVDNGGDGDSGKFDRVADIFRRQLGNDPAVGLMLVMFEGTPMPDSASREKAAALFNELGERFKCLDVVLLGGGFWASALRSAITGLGLMLRRQRTARVYTSIESAAEDAAELLGTGNAAEIAAACEDLSTRLTG
ncbi:hypothetical protein G6O69_16955 [Pseudenhygromyxa sp. WMMC2535]|uniref:hypothetical protein n=1 Tax=Pseudenhygromyxa sp. WMMC2535 TaxID=2712867 RepID=UPI00155435F4|nr:hypothetical protein [Pseudenhygromyxa sp. WMMC2535]NVB39534.1 hypothetical protein [Pseudenhygromyxa sp. WMMC2535]